MSNVVRSIALLGYSSVWPTLSICIISKDFPSFFKISSREILKVTGENRSSFGSPKIQRTGDLIVFSNGCGSKSNTVRSHFRCVSLAGSGIEEIYILNWHLVPNYKN